MEFGEHYPVWAVPCTRHVHKIRSADCARVMAIATARCREQTACSQIRPDLAMTAGHRRIAHCIAAMVLAMPVMGQSYDPAAVRMFHILDSEPNPLARYLYLERIIPGLSGGDAILAEQMSAFALSELGLYTQAVLAFPLKLKPVANLRLPDTADWKAVNAKEEIARLAAHRKIVMINEIHHNAQTRVLTLELLPELRKLGFDHLAIEALANDPKLTKRGYPIRSSGTEYLLEPIYGDIVREAIRLGFTLVPYDDGTPGGDVQARETGQANEIYERVFAHDPDARLVVAAGYAHIDKAVGRLGQARPMAMVLAGLTGMTPLSIDQTQFVDMEWGEDQYHRMLSRFPTDKPEALVNRNTGNPWSAMPKFHDISVISPPTLSLKAFGNSTNVMTRPTWLALGGLRHPYPIDTHLCRSQMPCAIDAHYIDEPDDATPADIYAFFNDNSSTRLYLRPGRYRLRAWNSEGRVLSEFKITVH